MAGIRLIVAEKPSVAASIARVVSATERKKGYYIGKTDYVTYCIGHLASLAEPHQYDEKFAKWNLNDLPIVPQTYKTVPVPETKEQLDVVVSLMRRNEVDTIVCATDSAREGELIFRRVYELAGVQKRVMRLWVSSSEDAAYHKGLAEMKPDSDYDDLYRSGYSRSVADWLVGMNCTRAYSVLYGTKGALPIGRVKTPVLAFIVDREKEIRNFVPEPYYLVTASFGDYAGRRRVKNKAEAANMKSLVGCPAKVIKAVKADKEERPPLLFATTEIMKYANAKFGFPADMTLALLQSLYDKKLTTYPRVESQYLTSDMEDLAFERARRLAAKFGVPEEDIGPVPKRLINDKKCEEHYALMPTDTAVEADISSLSNDERAIFTAIVFRLFCALGKPRQYTQQKIETEVDGRYVFLTSGSHDTDPGWKAVEQRLFAVLGKEIKPEEEAGQDEDEEVQDLPKLTEGDERTVAKVDSAEKKTKPPKRYTDSSLLSVMENAGRSIAEINLKNAISECGLGTPATRAETIKSLFSDGYAKREGKYIVPTAKGETLIDVVDPHLKSPVLTAEWEQNLKLISEGKYDYNTFIKEIGLFVSGQVKAIQAKQRTEGSTARELFHSSTREMIGKCPRCGKYVFENSKGYCCEDRFCGFAVWKDNRFSKNFKKQITPSVMKQFLFKKTVHMKGLTSKSGKKFDCDVRMVDTGKFVNFELSFKE